MFPWAPGNVDVRDCVTAPAVCVCLGQPGKNEGPWRQGLYLLCLPVLPLPLHPGRRSVRTRRQVHIGQRLNIHRLIYIALIPDPRGGPTEQSTPKCLITEYRFHAESNLAEEPVEEKNNLHTQETILPQVCITGCANFKLVSR